jgi:hypothetical protein
MPDTLEILTIDPFARAQVRYRRAAQVENALHIDIDDVVDFVITRVLQHREVAHARVVHQRINPAEPLDRGADNLIREGALADITSDYKCPRRIKGRGNFLAFLSVARVDDDVGPFGVEAPRYTFTNPGRGARDYDRFSCKPF